MHLCALCIANKPKNVTRQDLKNAPLCILYSKEAIKHLLIFLSWSNKAQTAEKSNEFGMLFLAVFCLLSPDLAQKIGPNIKYEFWIPQWVGGSGETSQYIIYISLNFLLQY